MDPATISLIVGVGILFIERLFSYLSQIKKSSCSNCCSCEQQTPKRKINIMHRATKNKETLQPTAEPPKSQEAVSK